MSWLPAIGLAVAALVLLVFVLKAPRRGWEALGAALLLGIAGYALQGRPGLAGAPRAADEKMTGNGAAIVAARQALQGGAGAGTNQWLVIGDALARNGQYADAAGVLVGAVRKDPQGVDGWLALGNSLVGHAQGNLSPAALYAYRRAAAADPAHPGPPFFLGLALAQAGRLAEGRALWSELLARSPADAPWRADLAARLARLDAFIAAQSGAPQTVPQAR